MIYIYTKSSLGRIHFLDGRSDFDMHALSYFWNSLKFGSSAKIEIYFSGEDDEEFYLAAEGSVARISRFKEKSQDMKSEGNSKTNDSRGNTHQPK